MPDPHPVPVARASKKPAGAQRIVVFVALIALVGFAYGAGRLQTAGQIKAANRLAEAASASASAERALFAESRQRIAVLEARRRIALAESALEERNFGTAEAHLHAGGALLARGPASPAVTEISAALTNARLMATEDLGSQRRTIKNWAARVDELVPPMKP